MASADILNQIKANKEKIKQLKVIKNSISTLSSDVRKTEREYKYNSNQWAGNKEREITKDLGLGSNGMNGVRNHIADDGKSAISQIDSYISNLNWKISMLNLQYDAAVAVEKYEKEKAEKAKAEKEKNK